MLEPANLANKGRYVNNRLCHFGAAVLSIQGGGGMPLASEVSSGKKYCARYEFL